jgi:hypothetical protein
MTVSPIMMNVRFVAAALVIGMMACGGSNEAPTAVPPETPAPRTLPTVFPSASGTWATIAPASLGWDTTALNAASDWVGSQQSTAFVIVWRGRIVAERYWRGWTAAGSTCLTWCGSCQATRRRASADE